MKKQNFYTIKDFRELSKQYGWAGNYSSTVQSILKKYNISHVKYVEVGIARKKTRVYNQKVFDFLQMYFDIQIKKRQLHERIRQYNELLQKQLKEINK